MINNLARSCNRFRARKRYGPELRARLMENLSAHQRMRAAVLAGNNTALVELCLQLQDQVTQLSSVVMAQGQAEGRGAGGDGSLWDYGATTGAQTAHFRAQ
jgi:hypothetical protein